MTHLKKSLSIVFLSVLVTLICLPCDLAEARGGGGGGRGGGGGGGGARGGGGGGGRGSASMSRSASRPSPSRQRSSFDNARPAPRPVQPARPMAYPQNIQRPPAGMNRIPNQPSGQVRRPSNMPSRPSGSQRYDSVQRPANLPARPSVPANRPGQGAGRPTQADIDRFLQNQPDNRPGSPSQLPATRPDRPAGGQRPSTLPGSPGIANRPGGPGPGTRPGRPGNRPVRPEQLPANWQNNWNDWQNKGDQIREDWYNDNYHHYHGDWYGDAWWDDHYHPYWPYYEDCYDCDWWSCPSTWTDMGSFMGNYLVPTPVFYTYGPGGSVFVAGDTVVLNDDKQLSTDAYDKELANQVDSIPEGASGEMDWLPLGVFTIVDEDAPESTMFLQLTVSKTGVIAGMFQNSTTENVMPVEGSVDSKSSRVVIRPTGKEYPMIETGLYNLIQDQTQVLVHFEGGKVQQGLLVRVDKPTSGTGGEGTPEGSTKGGKAQGEEPQQK
jgi:hypothetical protein